MADKNHLKNVYEDFFSPVLDGVREGIKETKKTRQKADPQASLKQAEDALAEARKLFGQDVKDFLTPEEKAALGLTEEKKKDDKTRPEPPLPEAVAAKEEVPETPREPERDPMEELDELIGLATIKHDVKELMDFVKIQKMRKDQGLKSVPVSLHLVFTGNPGTGKTTVARIISRLYKQIGVLSKGQLVEVDRSGLVAGFVGQTALKCQDKIKEAMGGVLFIDEAYALIGDERDTFGQEAVDTILKAMEDHRDDLVVIVAGYTAPMEKFINSNPGLKSRFNKYIEFPDYTIDELEAIFNMNCSRYDYKVEEMAKPQIRAQIVARKFRELENFANAREVRNMFEEIITNQARRVSLMENPSAEDMMLITLDDLMEAEEAAKAQEAMPEVPGDAEGAKDAPALSFDAPAEETSAKEAPAEETSSEEKPAAEAPAPAEEKNEAEPEADKA